MLRPKNIPLFLLLFAVHPRMDTHLPPQETITYKCMVQTINYTGENAYIVISLMNPQGAYDRTLHIMGDDPEWYHLFDEWWPYFGKESRNVDASTGATLGAGARRVIAFEVESDKVDKGYKIRFETQVEDREYHPADVEIPLTSQTPKGPVEGSGYIKQVRLLAN